jgi:HK97 gp10 family phage protein
VAWQEQISGYNEALAVFDYLRSDFKEQVIDDGLNASAEIFKAAIEERVPVLTGNLKRKIEVKILKAIKGGTIKSIVIGASIAGPRPKKGEIDRPAYYAIAVEKGYMAGVREVRAKADTFKTLTTKSGRQWTRGSKARTATYSNGSTYVAPQPFVQPAFDAVKNQIAPAFMEAFARRINSKTKTFLVSRDLPHPDPNMRGLAH